MNLMSKIAVKGIILAIPKSPKIPYLPLLLTKKEKYPPMLGHLQT